MYDILKLTIMSGNFKLSEIQQRVKRLYAMGDINDTQLKELLSMLAEKANPELERPETLELIQNLAAKVTALEQTVKELKGLLAGTGSDDSEESAQYSAWEPWDGLSDQYQYGAIVDHNGQLWQSTFPGQNVWEPGTVDDRFWAKYTEGGAE